MTEPVAVPREKPRDIGGTPLHVPVAWDDSINAVPYPDHADDSPHLRDDDRLCLRKGLRIRDEHVGALIQYGRWTRYLTRSALPLLQRLTAATSVRELIDTFSADRDLLANLVQLGILERADRHGSERSAVFYTNDWRRADCYSMPVSLMFEITNKCYRTCTYCAYSSGPNPSISLHDEMPTEWWLSRIADAANEGVMVIEFTGGDPFVRPDACELMAAADRMGIGLLINSDLSILREEDLDQLSKLQNLVAVQTSLDGADEVTCDHTRGRGGFKTLLRQLRQLKAAKLPVNVGTTVTTGNYSQVRAIAELAEAEGVGGMYIGPMYAAGRGASLSSLLVSESQWREACVQFAKAVAGGVVKPANYAWHHVAQTLLDTGVSPVQDQPVMSSRGNYNLRIDPKGTAYVTAKLREFRRRYSSVGDLRSTSLRTVWRSSYLLEELRSYPVELNVFDGIDIRMIPEDFDHVVHDDSRKELT